MLDRLNVQSKQYSGNRVFPANPNRSYLYIVFTTAAGTVELGDGGGKIPLPINGFMEPYVCPTCSISIETTGDFVIVEG